MKRNCLIIILCALFLSSCSSNSGTATNSGNEKASSSQTIVKSSYVANTDIVKNDMIKYESDDYYSDWKNQNPNYIVLNGASAAIKGTGATISGSKINISEAGVYVISGRLDNGQVTVDVNDKGTVRLVLNGAELNCLDSSPIFVKSAGKAIISLQEGTQNTITDGKKYVFADAKTDEPSAAIFSKDDLVINGTGKLTVHGNYNDGIAGKDDLKITDGNISVYSVDDGLIGKNMVLVKDGRISIDAGGDGIKSTNEEDKSKGFIALEAGTYSIKAANDGIQAKASVLIKEGKYTIATGGGSSNGIKKNDKDMRGPWEDQGNNEANNQTDTGEAEKKSSKGIKASSDISIKGGTIIIDSADDAISSNNSINLWDGNISIKSGDDGIHADSSVAINNGKIDIQKSYEGIESTHITIANGEIYVVASDDGVNISGGNDGSSVNGRPGQNKFSSSGSGKLEIKGGNLSVDSTGDGLDANGSIEMTGGTVVVSGPTENFNGALDYDGTFLISGGTLVAAGSSGMVQGPSEESKQYSVVMYYSSLQKSGSSVNLKDSKGNIVATYAPKREYQSVVISSPDLKKDTDYTFYSGESKVVGFTISKSVTWMSETGETESRGFGPGGRGGHGGLGDPDGGRAPRGQRNDGGSGAERNDGQI